LKQIFSQICQIYYLKQLSLFAVVSACISIVYRTGAFVIEFFLSITITKKEIFTSSSRVLSNLIQIL